MLENGDRMKVLWITNVAIKEAGETMGHTAVLSVSWLDSLSESIRNKLELTICYPTNETKELQEGNGIGVTFYAVPRKSRSGTKYEKELKTYFSHIYMKIKPDVIHIWGTEFPHTLSAVEAAEGCGCIDRVVISIQGLTSIYSRHFMADIPYYVRHMYSVKNILKGYNLNSQRNDYRKRGQYEEQALQMVKHVIGRTDWDKACIERINKAVNYHLNNETLRKDFYSGRWEYERCGKNSIFVPQSGSPIKGMHWALEIVAQLKEKYPDVHIYTTGKNIAGKLKLAEKIRLGSYDIYIRKLIKKYKLEDHITFLGTLSADEMKQQYLKANVFLLPSAIENSPNSLGEAMILGTPVVVADVGGVKNLVEHEKEGLVFPHDEPYVAAYYIQRIFENPVNSMVSKAREHAKVTHCLKKNETDLMNIYYTIAGVE